MTTFLLVPGAGGMSWYWHLVARRLSDAGHEALALDLPADDPDVGLSAYVDLSVAAAEGHDDLVVAAQSMGAFTAVPVCERLAARRLVLLNAMIPAPGETAGDWWENTGSEEARRAVPVHELAGRPDNRPRGSRRSRLPVPVPAASRAGAPGDRRAAVTRRAPQRAQPTGRLDARAAGLTLRVARLPDCAIIDA